MALEDSEALALLLQHHLKQDKFRGHLTAAKQYTQLRKPRVEIIHKTAQETAAMKQDMGIVQEMLMHFFVWMIGKCTKSGETIRT